MIDLVADIGATHVRFALVDDAGALTAIDVLRCAEHDSLEAAIGVYLARLPEPDRPRPRAVALAIAGPVTGDLVVMTNHHWRFSQAELARHLGVERLEVVNDLAAVAHALPELGPQDLVTWKDGTPAPEAPSAVIAPGTGLGMAVRLADGQVLAGEGGHQGFAPADADQRAVLERLARDADHVSAEHVLSGPGLLRVYRALAERAGAGGRDLDAAGVVRAASEEAADSPAGRAAAMFLDILGACAGDLALTVGARGGVFIAGGMPGRLAFALDQGRFSARFAAKGSMAGYLAPVPCRLIVHELPALLGLKHLLRVG